MRRIASLALVVALVFAACGDDAATTTTATPTTAAPSGFPVDVNGVTVPERPERIVSASAAHTEILFAVGAGDQVVATDAFSDFPPEALDTEKIDGFNISVETVAALDPDLVILFFDPGDVVDGLDQLGIPTLLFDPPATVDDAFDQWIDMGLATGNVAEAEQVVEDADEEIAAIVGDLPTPATPLTYYYELDPSGFSVTSDSFVGSLLQMMGMVSIADSTGTAFPQLSTEFIVEADPDWIVLADTVCCDANAETLGDRPGWAEMSAVAEGRVVGLDDSVASRWGPRIVDLVRQVAETVYGPLG
jgi:iron complex transport system substrate-binding protein